MKSPLTKKQRKTLDFVTTFIEQKGYSPSYREIANGLKLSSVATVAQHIDTLVEKGFLEKGNNSARSLIPVEEV
jgi:repressor LexA